MLAEWNVDKPKCQTKISMLKHAQSGGNTAGKSKKQVALSISKP